MPKTKLISPDIPIGCGLWQKPNKTMMWPNRQMWYTSKMILNCYDRSDQVLFVMKTKHNNDVIDCTDMVYAKNDIELPWLIESGVDSHENQIGTLHEWSYMCSLCQKRNWAIMMDQTRCGMWWKLDKTTTWLIIMVQSMLKMKLSYRDWLDWLKFVKKTRQDNDVSNSKYVVYIENETNLSCLIKPSGVCVENQTG